MSTELRNVRNPTAEQQYNYFQEKLDECFKERNRLGCQLALSGLRGAVNKKLQWR